MQGASVNGHLAEIGSATICLLPLMFGYGNGEEKSRSERRTSPPKKGPKKNGNRVLMLGSIRELALYRAEVLRHHGYNVVAPETEEEALEQIRRGEFDVVVLSYTLPDRTVEKYAQAVREYCADCPILAIAQTARMDRKIAPDAVVVAEKGPPELVMTLKRVLQRQ